MSKPSPYELDRFASYEANIVKHAATAFDERRMPQKSNAYPWFYTAYRGGLIISEKRDPALLVALVEKIYPMIADSLEIIPKLVAGFGFQHGYELLDHLYRDERALLELKAAEKPFQPPDKSFAGTITAFSAIADCYNFVRCFQANGYFADDYRQIRATVEESLANNGLLEDWSARQTNTTRLEIELFPQDLPRPPIQNNDRGLEPHA